MTVPGEEAPDPELAMPPPRPVEPVSDPVRIDPRKNTLGRLMYGYFAVITVLWLVILMIAAWPPLRLRFLGQEARGVVTRKNDFRGSPSLAPAFYYRLSFDFQDASGRKVPADASVTPEVFERTRVGDELQVRYDPGRPGRWVQIEGQTDPPGRFVGAAAVWFVFCVIFTFQFRKTPARSDAMLRRLCSRGIVLTATITDVREHRPFVRSLVRFAYRNASDRERKGWLRLTTEQAALFPVGTRFSLLRHPRWPWIVCPYRLLPYRVPAPSSPSTGVA